MRVRRLLSVLAVIVAAVTVPETAAQATAAAPDFGFNYNPQAADQPGTGVRFLSGTTVAPLQVHVKAGSIHRFSVQWDEIERVQGLYGFGPVDSRVGPVADAGLRLLPVLIDAPSFHRDTLENLQCVGGAACVLPPADTAAKLAAFEEYVKRLIDHFSAGRYAGRLAGLEIWNEPNWTRYWQTLAGPDPARLAHLMCRARKGALRSLLPGVPLGVGGLIPWDNDADGHENNAPPADALNRNILMRDYLARMYATHDAEVTDLRDCIDAVSVHNYALAQPPDDPAKLFLDPLSDLRAVFAQNGDTGRAIWITEAGQGVGTEPGQVATEQIQSDLIVCSYQLVADDADVKLFIQHVLVDIPEGGAFGQMGAYRFDASGTPAPRPYRDALASLFAQYGDNVPSVTAC